MLLELARLGEVSVGSLAAAVHLSRPTLTGILDRLEAKGWVARRRGVGDRRRVLVKITSEGDRLLDSAPAPLQQSFLERLDSMEDWEQHQILSVLERLVSIMEADRIDASPVLATGSLGGPES